jgi:hypothetical protein
MGYFFEQRGDHVESIGMEAQLGLVDDDEFR